MTLLIALQEIPNSVAMITPGMRFIEQDPERAEYWIKQGYASPIETPKRINARGWDGLLWDGATVCLIASGPSLTQEQCDAAKKWRSGSGNRRAIVINTSFRIAPWADLLYACDKRWWDKHYDEVLASGFGGERWTTEDFSGAKRITSERLPGLGKRPGIIRQGMQSGYQAMNLAWMAGATKLILLGFDCKPDGKKEHWHGDHPHGMNAKNPYNAWVKNFEALAADLNQEGCEVINATPFSAIEVFPKMDWQEALA